jgi:hypothetical protein
MAILEDLDVLDNATERIKDPHTQEDAQFDIDFVDMINEYSDNKGINIKRVKPVKEQADKRYDMVKRFISTYPYLSYIMMKTQRMMSYYILMTGHLDMLNKVDKDTMNILAVDNVA